MNMKILICPDSFKGSISAKAATDAIADGLRSVLPETELVCLPVADGGEGTLDVLTKQENRFSLRVTGPDLSPVTAEYGHIGDTAVIEMARAAGLTLVPPNHRDPAAATTYGVGEMIRDALDRGFRKILLTAGGSATNDGGSGILEALGVQFFDQNGNHISGCGGNLGAIHKVDLSTLDPRFSLCSFTVATDVNNPLCGKNGATAVFGPQKGATALQLELLEKGMCHYVSLLETMTGKQIADVPGCGAAGGLPVPFLAFADVRIRSGISCVLDACGFSEHLKGCSAVITGEGKTDCQSVMGKVLQGVSVPAKEAGIPVYVLSGCAENIPDELYGIGVREVRTIVSLGVSQEDAMRNAATYLKRLATGLALDRFASVAQN